MLARGSLGEHAPCWASLSLGREGGTRAWRAATGKRASSGGPWATFVDQNASGIVVGSLCCPDDGDDTNEHLDRVLVRGLDGAHIKTDLK